MAREINGIGLGLRKPFIDELLATGRRVDWLEVTPENWVRFGGIWRRKLDACLERWPAVCHSVSLSVGGPDPLDEDFLGAVAALSRRVQAPFFSDHVCYSAVGGPVHDLLPLPFNEEVLLHTAARAREAQERAGLPLLLENATFYAHMPGCTMDEGDFLKSVLAEGQCGMLLDVNNVYVNSRNQGFDARAFIDRMPMERVRQLHLAGHTLIRGTLIDTHIGPVIDEVWALYRHTLRRAGRMIPTLIEWDQDIPPLDQVLDEVDRARAAAAEALPAGGREP